MKDKKLLIAVIINTVVILTEALAFFWSYQMHGFGLFVYYTEDSNLFATLVSVLFIVFAIIKFKTGKEIPEFVKILKYTAISCLTLTFLVVVLLLGPTSNGLFWELLTYKCMFVHHTFAPIALFISFIFFECDFKITAKQSAYALIPTGIYAVILVILNLTKTVVGPYFFLEVYTRPWWATVLWGIVVLGLAYLIVLGVKILKNKLNK